MEKAIDGMERMEAAMARAENPLVLNAKTAEQYHAVKKQMGELLHVATPEDAVVLDGLKEAANRCESVLKQHAKRLESGMYQLNSTVGENGIAAFEKATSEFIDIQNKVAAFCRGEKIEGIQHIASPALTKAFTETEHAASKLIGKASNLFGVVRTQENGWSVALKNNAEKMNGFKAGLAPMERGKAFGRCGVVVGSAVALGDALFRSKDSNDEDRSGAFRVIEAVAAGAVGATALLHGRAIARI